MFEPVDYFKLAVEINQSHKHQAGYRCVVSRAYYSAFLAARNASGVSSKEQDGHQRVAQYFHNKGDSKSGTLANRLDAMRTERKDADYDCVKEVNHLNSGRTLASAQKVLESLGVIVPPAKT